MISLGGQGKEPIVLQIQITKRGKIVRKQAWNHGQQVPRQILDRIHKGSNVRTLPKSYSLEMHLPIREVQMNN